MKLCFVILFACLLPWMASASEESRLLRFPTIHNDQIVFSYAGDLYTVNSSGGVARRLTSDVGYEMFARFSPSGRYIAFTGQYDGNTEVYVMPREGGVPKRLTYTPVLERDDVSDRMGPNNIVMGWKDDEHIIYRSRGREWNDFKGQLYLVAIQGGLSEQLPLPRGGFCSYSPDKTKLVYNRVFREFRTWKRYRGGQADDIWIYDFASKTTTNITNNLAQDIIPMWYGDKIYFLSDREQRLNLYSYDLKSQETKKLTHFSDFDVKFPSLGDKMIVFENGGYVYRFDLFTENVEKVTIYIQEDLAWGRTTLVDVSGHITNYEIAPDGKRAIFGARGDIFTVPAKHGLTRNISATCGIHERSGKWSPDGRHIAFISDMSGEDEIYIVAQNGEGKPVQLTSNSDTYKFTIRWSPDSKKIMWNDKMQRLQFVEVESKKVTLVAQAASWEITSFTWSPDSKWIAYGSPQDELTAAIYLYSLAEQKSHAVTDNWYNSYGAAFSEDGKYLYFISQRNFAPTYGENEWNHIYLNMAKLYLVTLNKDAKSPFAPKNDEVEITEEKKEEKAAEKQEEKKDEEKKEDKAAAKKEEKKEEKPIVKVDFEGIVDRIIEIPVPGSSYSDLAAVGNQLYYLRNSEEKWRLFLYDFESLKETELGEISGYEISADKKKMLVGQSNSYAIIALPSAKIEMQDTLSLAGLKVMLNRHEEWRQIFNECWRQMRDFFFAPNLHGVNWQAVRKHYERLVEHVNHRADLTYIIGEMIAELNCGHTYVGGGDYPRAPRVRTGLLGAVLERDKDCGYYWVQKIWKGQNWNKRLRSPLTEVGVDVKVGDYILAVNGKATSDISDIYAALVDTVGKQVVLKVNGVPKLDGCREVIVIPTGDEQELVYFNWVQTNIKKVNKATNGRVGYLHVPDMGDDGLNEFCKYFYPQLRKEALIIDVRGNGGGNVSSILIERLRRELAMIGIARNTSLYYDPSGMHYGPKVCLLDEFSASDGDIFPYRFRHYKLGKLVGKRSWGGVVGIRDSLPLLDGGYLFKPEFSQYDLAGKEWMMEGHGVDPDIYVDNDPAAEFSGVDQQLDKGIEVVVEELKNYPKLPPAPPYPDKSK